ncbi:MAG: hypothetical protein SGCHY_003752 [Lobulomycetales sp.]
MDQYRQALEIVKGRKKPEKADLLEKPGKGRSKAEVVDIMQWKLTRGKFRPLMKLVKVMPFDLTRDQGLDEDILEETMLECLEMLPEQSDIPSIDTICKCVKLLSRKGAFSVLLIKTKS